MISNKVYSFVSILTLRPKPSVFSHHRNSPSIQINWESFFFGGLKLSRDLQIDSDVIFKWINQSSSTFTKEKRSSHSPKSAKKSYQLKKHSLNWIQNTSWVLVAHSIAIHSVILFFSQVNVFAHSKKLNEKKRSNSLLEREQHIIMS